MAGVNVAGTVDNITPAESIKAGWDKHNAHWHEYDAVLLTNSAAGSTAVGDVLAVSSQTAILGDTVSSLQKYVVAAAVIANAATGEFVRAGVISAKSTGAIAAGQYVRKSVTARTIEDAGVAVGATAAPPSGTVGIALAAASGGFCTIFLFDATVSSAGAFTFAGADTVERTTVSTSSVTLSTIAVTSIPVTSGILVCIPWKKTSGAAASCSIGITLNATDTLTIAVLSSSANQLEQGVVWAYFQPYDAAYFYPLALTIVSTATLFNNWGAIARPNAAVTSVLIKGLVSSGSITLGVKNAMVYALGGS